MSLYRRLIMRRAEVTVLWRPLIDNGLVTVRTYADRMPPSSQPRETGKCHTSWRAGGVIRTTSQLHLAWCSSIGCSTAGTRPIPAHDGGASDQITRLGARLGTGTFHLPLPSSIHGSGPSILPQAISPLTRPRSVPAAPTAQNLFPSPLIPAAAGS